MGFSRSFKMEIILSVKISHPMPLWLFAAPRRTVKTVFSKSTPCCAHFVRFPLLGISAPKIRVKLGKNIFKVTEAAQRRPEPKSKDRAPAPARDRGPAPKAQP